MQDLQAAGADYVLALKRNQCTFHRNVGAAFAGAEQSIFTPTVQYHCETRMCGGCQLLDISSRRMATATQREP